MNSPSPTRPIVAASVEFVGEMRDVGMAEGQWLIRRQGRFVMVSELLYRLAQLCDGRRSVQEIAEELTRSTQWRLSAEDVSRLVATKLVPLDLVESEEPRSTGAPARAQKDPSRDGARSAFTVRMRRSILRPQRTEAVAGFLRLLHAPAIVVSVLVLVIGGHAWLYLVHGVSGSIASVLAQPSTFLAVVAILIAAALFHEMGHASALRYGGGHPGEIGMGFYLAFPAFYSNVTDSYRLPRRARMRVGLGGVYFHVLFSLGVIVAYLGTGLEFLLLAVVLIDIEVIRQFLPFGRLDGYWVLADAMGIPDPFSFALPALRDTRWFRSRHGATPTIQLKPHARRVLLGYLALSFLLIPLLILAIVLQTPRILGFAWDTAVSEAHELVNSSDVAAIAASLLHLVLLALQVGGLFLVLYLFGGRPLLRGWRWSASQPTAVRWVIRATMLGVSGAVLILFGVLFPWHSVGPVDVPGTSRPGGIPLLVAAVLIGTCAVAALFSRRLNFRFAAAIGMVVLGLAAAGMAIRDSSIPADVAGDAIRRVASETSLGRQVRRQIGAQNLVPSPSYGMGLTVAGGAACTLGGVATLGTLLARKRFRAPTSLPAPDEIQQDRSVR